MTDDFAWLDACAQAELVRRGDVSPLELVDAAIARIDALDPDLNAVITRFFDDARQIAQSDDLPDGPFRGVPFLLKDIGACLEGMPLYMGNKALRDVDYRCPEDSPLACRFRDAGFVVLGKTNTPECGAVSTTQPLAFGPTRNPWDTTRSTNGSSGGSCAAVASGMVSIAHANDGAGSIRMPAAWCGLVGLKPSRGRVSYGTLFGGVIRNLAEFTVTRTVRDTAAALDAVHGSEPGDLFLIPAPERRYAEEVGAHAGHLRIGIMTEMPGVSTHPECVAGTESAGRLLESLGHILEPVFPQALHEEPDVELGMKMGVFAFRSLLGDLAERLGRPIQEEDVEPYMWQMASIPVDVSLEDGARAQVEQHMQAVRIARWWSEGFDLLLTPTVYEPAATLEELTPLPGAEVMFGMRVLQTCCFTEPFNVTGHPAISLPLHQTEAGLPVGVQLVADMAREDVLIRVASQLEQAAPWIDRRPLISA